MPCPEELRTSLHIQAWFLLVFCTVRVNGFRQDQRNSRSKHRNDYSQRQPAKVHSKTAMPPKKANIQPKNSGFPTVIFLDAVPSFIAFFQISFRQVYFARFCKARFRSASNFLSESKCFPERADRNVICSKPSPLAWSLFSPFYHRLYFERTTAGCTNSSGLFVGVCWK